MNVLFITRKYPPAIGGMENVSYALSNELAKITPTTIIAWGRSQKLLFYFILKALMLSIYSIQKKNITNIHIADGLLSPVGLILKVLTRKKISVTVHGLDVTYKNRIYQVIVPFCIKHLDSIICISEATKMECIQRGIPDKKITVIGWGVYLEEYMMTSSRSDLRNVLGTDLGNKKIIITVGRLVKRKGVEWFIREVMPLLKHNYTYLIIGDGKEKISIHNAITELDLATSVLLLGKLDDATLKTIYANADVFIMPNIPVKGDIEGYGIVAVEATASGVPVVASNIEGISDVVINKKNGILVEAKNSEAFKNAILNINIPSKVILDTANRFKWSNIAIKYLETI